MYTDGRLGVPPLDSLTEHLHRVELESELEALADFVEIDLAHVLMLTERGILSRSTGADLLQALLRIAGPNPEVKLPINPAAGSILLQVEAYLVAECGPAGGMLQTARSRIDQDAEGMRMTARRWGMQVLGGLIALAATQLDAAERYDSLRAPGYTQMQHSQPGTLGHYFNSHYWVTSRGIERLREALNRADQSSLGGVALVGTDWPIDRARVAAFLGHLGVIPNARDAGVFALDTNAELAAVLALVMSGLGRLAGDLYFWASSEVGLVRLHAGLCGTSSIMPQKRNPYSLQRIRALAGEAIGWPASQLGILKLATSTDLDIVCASNRIPEICHATIGAALLMSDSIRTLEVNVEGMRRSAGAHWSTASALADQLVRKTGCSFRAAHDIVARLVRLAEERGLDSDHVGSDLLQEAAQEAELEIDSAAVDIKEALDVDRFIASRSSPGACGTERRVELMHAASADLRGHREHFATATARIERAHDALMAAARHMIDSR